MLDPYFRSFDDAVIIDIEEIRKDEVETQDLLIYEDSINAIQINLHLDANGKFLRFIIKPSLFVSHYLTISPFER